MELNKLKYNWEQTLISSIEVDNAAYIFSQADRHYTDSLRDVCLRYILKNFDKVSKTSSFESLVKHSPELVIEVLRERKII